MKCLSSLFMRCMILVTLLLFGCSIFFTNNLTYPSHSLLSLLVAIPILFFWIFLYQRIVPFLSKCTKKQEIFILMIYFFCFFLLQLFFFRELKVTPGWDFGELYRSALSYVNHEPVAFAAYFEYCPNNIFIYLCYIILFKIAQFFHITNVLNLLGICNIFLIGLSVFLMYLVAKKLYSKKAAFTLLFLVFFFSPLFLYTPIIYTDTVTLFIPVLLIFLFLQVEQSDKKKQFLWILLFSLVAFVGYKLKMSCLIMVVALFIHLFLKKEFVVLTKFVGVFLVVFLSFSTLFQHFILEREAFHFQDNGVGELPFTHYLMMGLEDPNADHSERRTYGGFSGTDLDYTKSIPSSSRKSIHKEEILRRLKSYTFLSLLQYYGHKISNTWGDGTYFAPMKISQQPIKQSFLHPFVLQTGKYFDIYLYFAQGVQYAFLFLLFISVVTTRNDFTKSYLYFAIFGLFLFLLIWETRSRYLVNYIPIFLLSIVPALDFISNKFDKKI